MESQDLKVKSKASRAKPEAREEMSSQCGANPSMKPDSASVPSPTKPKRKRKKEASKSTSVDANKSAPPSGFSKVSQSSGGGDLLTRAKPVAKLPSSREDSSSNWKTLSEAHGKRLKTPPPPPVWIPKKIIEKPAKDDGEEHKQTGSAAESQSGAKPKKKKTKKVPVRKLPGEGLNSFGFFNYTHYGVLLTPIVPAHKEFIQDTGILAMDCEMVGVGPMKESALARISIVNEFGYCLYDKFVKPKVEVTDYRTEFSGIREADLRNATPFETVGKEVSSIIKSRILVGHSLKHDFAVLYFTHPKARTRDTADYFKKILHAKTPALRTLTKKILGVEIQQGEHSPIVDAQATMTLYRICQKDWEHSVRQKNRGVDIFKQTVDEFRANAVASPVP